MAEIVTFKCSGKVMHYRPGNIYTEELTPLVKMLLLKDHQLNLIDPPTLEVKEKETVWEEDVIPAKMTYQKGTSTLATAKHAAKNAHMLDTDLGENTSESKRRPSGSASAEQV